MMTPDSSIPIVADRQQITQPRSTGATMPKAVATALLTDSAVTLYTANTRTAPIGAVCRAKLMGIVFCNTDSSARTVTLYIITTGGSAGTSNTILAAASIAAGTTWVFDPGPYGITLAAGDFIQGKASVTNVVTHRISVEEFL